MVLESLLNPLKAEKKPWEVFLLGFLYSSIAVFLSLWIFERYASLVLVFLTVISCIPLIYGVIRAEEKKDLIIEKESKLLKEHGKALLFFIVLFLGITLSLTVWYVFLPTDVSSRLFEIQQQTILDINNQITGNISMQANLFLKIFLNNMKVMTFAILFAFIYGFGAMFILTWNASVISVAIGNFIRFHLSNIANTVGFVSIGSYFQIFSLGILRYMAHGIFEILAYFTAGLAGGIISVAVIRHDFRTKKFEHIVLDSADLLIISIFILVLAAFIEVFVTPYLF
ncbi:MAG: stage II sporulation protein M [Candidatus Woesearchaeota archaeon]|jgi:uncharacterized membrane protein SpoIIM required for sporulation|nr:stage II sporulation protein M [Candidatus Woesearchaeota archaeon]MDP7506592.1 stage II sporulation protein M [Candidatus Woesearchaeota archaeon]MDP7610247.1 stage II sporulation protein M [Candidatus Woesearchaeota archaeon]